MVLEVAVLDPKVHSCAGLQISLFTGWAIRWVLRCILSLGVALSLIDATLPRLLAYVLDVVRVQCSVTCRGFGCFPGSQVQHEGDRCSKAIRDSSLRLGL